MKFVRLIPAALAVTLLSGCAGMNSNFDCPLGTSTSCKSVGQVNQMVNQGDFNTKGHATSTQASTPQLEGSLPYKIGDPIWIPATIVRVWIAPFVDSNNVYHQSWQTLYVSAKKGHWLGSPPKVVKFKDNAYGWEGSDAS